MAAKALARRNPSSKPRRSASRSRNPRQQNPGALVTGAMMLGAGIAGAGIMHLAMRPSAGTIEASYNGYSYTIKPAGGGYSWGLAQGKTQLAGGATTTVGEALGAVGQALDVAIYP